MHNHNADHTIELINLKCVLYAKDITDACNVAATASIPLTCNRQASSRLAGCPAGRNLYSQYATNHYSGL